jgi:hypothetical protein
MTARERQMLEALPHRHAHRGPLADGPLPAGLLAGLQHDALAQGSRWHWSTRPSPTSGWPTSLPRPAAGKIWTPHPGRGAPVEPGPVRSCPRRRPADAFPGWAGSQPGRLRQRDFDLGRGLGLLATGGPPPAATAVLLTPGDGRADWLRAGQALHRLLAHAASNWVFASLYTQPLDAAAIRDLIRDRLALPGAPQMLLQLGLADTSHATARRPPDDLIEP